METTLPLPYEKRHQFSKEEKADIARFLFIPEKNLGDIKLLRQKVLHVCERKHTIALLPTKVQELIADILISHSDLNVYLKINDQLSINQQSETDTIVYYRKRDLTNLELILERYKIENSLSREGDKQGLHFILLCTHLLRGDMVKAGECTNSLRTNMLLKMKEDVNKEGLVVAKLSIQQIYYLIAIMDYYLAVYNLEKAEETLELIEMISQIQNDILLGTIVLYYYAKLDMMKGNYLTAGEKINEALEYEKIARNKELQIELEYLKARILAFFERYDHARAVIEEVSKQELSNTMLGLKHLTLGQIFYRQGKIEECKKVLNELDEQYYIIDKGIYFDYLLLSVRINIAKLSADEIKKNLQYLQEYANRSENDIYHAKTLIVLSELYKKRKKYDEAINQLEKALKKLEHKPIFQLRLESLLGIIDLYTRRFFNTEEIEDFSKVFGYLEELIEFGRKNEFSYVEAMAYHIKGKIYGRFSKIDESKEALFKAQDIANKYGFTKLDNQINTDLRKLEREGELLQQTTSLDSLIDTVGGAQYEEMQKEQKKSSKPEAFIIIEKESGIPLYQFHFNEEKKDVESTLLSGLITAVLMFASNILRTKEVQSFKFVDYSILIVIEDEIIYMFMADQKTDENKQKLIRLVKMFEVFDLKTLKPYIQTNFETLNKLVEKIFVEKNA